mmetsp:Transcript_10553/g.16228  ORF Transcript_10553/g.16228 Transcript_10553/m.16228 type:complete len:99 (+) Transcript_10553:564-860(+)
MRNGEKKPSSQRTPRRSKNRSNETLWRGKRDSCTNLSLLPRTVFLVRSCYILFIFPLSSPVQSSHSSGDLLRVSFVLMKYILLKPTLQQFIHECIIAW